MALNSSGPLSIGGATTGQSINLELGFSATAQGALNDTSFRTLAGVSTGQISISNFYGKSNVPPYFLTTLTSASTVPLTTLTTFISASGNMYVVSRREATPWIYLTKLLASGLESWTTTIAQNLNATNPNNCAVNEDSSGNVYLAFSNGFYLFKFTSTGTVSFRKTFTVTGPSDGLQCYVDQFGNFYFTGGYSSYPAKPFVIKYNNTGTLVYEKTFQLGAAYNTRVQDSYGVDSSGNFYWGNLTYNSGYSSICYILKLSSDGSTITAKQLTSTSGNIFGDSIAVSTTGNVFVAGVLNIFGARTLVSLSSDLSTINWAVSGVGGNGWGAVSAGPSGGALAWMDQVGAYDKRSVFVNSSGALTSTVSFRTVASTTANGTVGYLPRLISDASSSIYYSVGQYTNMPWVAIRLNPDFSTAGSYNVLTATGGYPCQIYAEKSTLPTIASVASSFASPTNVSYTLVTGRTVSTSDVTPTIASATLTLANTALNTATGGSNTFAQSGTFSWVCPAGVTSVSVVCVGGGGGGYYQNSGAGGGLGYKNNMSVTPGTSYTVEVGTAGAGGRYTSSSGGNSWFSNINIVKGGFGPSGQAGGVSSSTGDGGGIGGFAQNFAGGGGGGGYGGLSTYAPAGGGGGTGFSGDYYNPSYKGGGVGLMGQGINGVNGTSYASYNGGSGGQAGYAGGSFGGAGNAGYYSLEYCCYNYGGYYYYNNAGGYGSPGAVRIIWPGTTRTFPSTNTGFP